MAPLASPAAAQRGTTQAQASRANTGTAQAAGTDAGTAQRGTTTIPAKVVAKIAAEAAYETGNVGSNAGGGLGIGARCELYGQVAVLHMNLGLVFPTPLADTIEAVRAHVRSRVEHLTGLSVGKINIEISWLNPAGPGRKNLK